jgi:hypothetical protein
MQNLDTKPLPTATVDLPPSTEMGKLKVMHLKRYFEKSILKRDRKLPPDSLQDEWRKDTMLLGVLGLGLEQAMVKIYRDCQSLDEFEDWVLEVSGEPDAAMVKQFNALFSGAKNDHSQDVTEDDVLTTEDLDFWDENGYVIVRDAISKKAAERTVELICEHLKIDRYDPSTWYNSHPSKQGIMIQLFQHPQLDENRQSARIRKAYEQLWKRTDLWVNADRVGFNPPETPQLPFQGSRLHWDASIKQPIPFNTQGIIYLADVAENQGAFSLVPGFHNRIGEWLKSLPESANPRTQNLYELGVKPIAANAGDLIIWHVALPHGASPNNATLPRFVQYINYAPADERENVEWL